ncbi:hypothetical protein BC629DRAFT_1587345 [Irpex lacteus]|nr:hypothetical protein BC629DRAFT_1587345 [Irpex lacteus]
MTTYTYIDVYAARFQGQASAHPVFSPHKHCALPGGFMPSTSFPSAPGPSRSRPVHAHPVPALPIKALAFNAAPTANSSTSKRAMRSAHTHHQPTPPPVHHARYAQDYPRATSRGGTVDDRMDMKCPGAPLMRTIPLPEVEDAFHERRHSHPNHVHPL